jgi:putative membrane protein
MLVLGTRDVDREETQQMYVHDGWGFAGWWVMMLGMLFFLILVVVLVVALVRWTGPGGDRRDGVPDSGRSEALRILDERFARGDLTEEEYRQRRQVLLER